MVYFKQKSINAAQFNSKNKEVMKMKKIIFFTMTMVFALAIGAAYAGMEGGHDVMFNGITNFSARGYDTTSDALKIDAADWGVVRGVAEVEGASAGGLRAGEIELHPYNGITNFSGRGYDTTSDALKIDAADWGAVRSPIEGASAGGLRAGEIELHPYNGVTDFSGRSYNTTSDALLL